MGGAVAAVASAIGSALAASNVVSFVVTMVASSIISKIFAPKPPSLGDQTNPGSRQQLPPAGSNKLPVVYGDAWVGGIVTDVSITKGLTGMLFVISLCETTNTESGVSVGGADNINFGEIWWGGKRCLFHDTDKTRVVGLEDPSNGKVIDVDEKLYFYLYNNGSNSPVNTTLTATQVFTDPAFNWELSWSWDGSQTMTNTVFAIVRLRYSVKKTITGLSPTKFQIKNSRKSPGDCFLDYLTSTRYGAGIPLSQVDINSLSELNVRSNQYINYTDYNGLLQVQKRFEFNGTIDTSQKIMTNLQTMSDCCNSLVRYNEMNSTWGVIVQSPNYKIAMDLNDSNIIGSITVTPIELSNSFNIIECAFADKENLDSFTTASFDLAQINPSLLYPNEPVNKQNVQLNLVNNSVQAQYLANQFLEASREDLQIQCTIDYLGLQLEAGDIVSLTNSNYGWSAKLFRVNRVTQKFDENATITAILNLQEFNPAVFDDYNVTQFRPQPNTGLPYPSTFSEVPKPIVVSQNPTDVIPNFVVQVTTPDIGLSQYAELYYSAYQYPTNDQLIFITTSEIQPNGEPYEPNYLLPNFVITNIPSGDWYIFTRMVNSIADSSFSDASDLVQWRPRTIQYTDRYLAIVYADDAIGTNITLNPRGKAYYGLYNQASTTVSIANPAIYKWFLADPVFGTDVYLAYANRGNRKFSFGTSTAGFSGSFVPTNTATYDIKLWSALEDGINYIDLDKVSGQLIATGTTKQYASQGIIAVENTEDGKIIAALEQFLDFGGAQTYTATAATLTIDIYGRVVGFSPPDNFYYTIENFTATSGQTVFTPTTRGAGFITGQDLIFKNGILLSTGDYTETNTTFTLGVGCTVGDVITCISMRAVSAGNTYATNNITVASASGNQVVYSSSTNPYQTINIGDKITFANSGTPTQYTVTAVNYATRTITFSTTLSGVTAGATIYTYRAAGSVYPAFSRYEFDLTSASSYTPTDWSIFTGYEFMFLNGTVVNEQDYDIVSGALTNFPASVTGKMIFLQFSQNNLTTPTGTPFTVITFTVSGQSTYSFNYTANAFTVYGNGALYRETSDYTLTSGAYILTTPINNATTVLYQQSYARVGAA